MKNNALIAQGLRPVIIFILAIIGLSACSLLQRQGFNESSGNSNSAVDFIREKQVYETQIIKEELGLPDQRPLTETEAQALQKRVYLKRLEDRLKSDRERKQYYSYKPFMSEEERIYFLRLSDLSSRQRWAQQRGLSTDAKKHNPEVIKLIERNDIAAGMHKQAVVESWGDPDAIEAAGNPIYENERWLYTKMISSDEGYEKQQRIIYFEAGRVVGWETL